MMDTILKDIEGCIWYFNDILSYSSNTEAEYQAIVKKVLQQYVEHELVVNLVKSKFYLHETIFLKHVTNGQKVNIDLSKVQSMFKWLSPAKKKEVQIFLDFAN